MRFHWISYLYIKREKYRISVDHLEVRRILTQQINEFSSVSVKVSVGENGADFASNSFLKYMLSSLWKHFGVLQVIL